MKSANPASSPCTWALVCEVARGLLASDQVDNPESFFKHLASTAQDYPAALGWARLALQNSADSEDLDYWFGEITSEPEQRRRARLNHVLCAELLLERRHDAQRICLTLSDLLSQSQLQPADVEAIWSAIDQAANASFDLLDKSITRLVAHPESAYALARALLQRLLCWPLFAPVGMPNAQGYSLPLAIIVDSCGSDLYQIEGELIRCVSPEALAIVRPSFERASKAGKQAWRAKHGRVYRPKRDQVAEYTVTFDFSPADLALRCLRDGDGDFVGRAYRGFVRREQRSIEAYLGQATLSRLLGRRFSSRAIATGCLELPEKSLTWRVCWTDQDEILLSTLLQKARHVGSRGAFQRLVVPSEPSELFTTLQNDLQSVRKSGSGLPHVIGAQDLSAVGDYCIIGQWRPERFIRCHSALSDANNTPVPPDLATQVLESFRHASRRALYIHAPRQTTEVVATLAQYLRATNKGYLDRQNEARRTTSPKRVSNRNIIATEIPSQIGYLVFRSVESEYGLAFFATLYHALAGHVDKSAVSTIACAYDSEQSATEVARWLNHLYAIEEPWEAPEILLVYGIEHLRAITSWREPMSSESTDVWDVLRRLPRGLDDAVGDERHAEALQRLRIVIVDGSEVPDPTLIDTKDTWDSCLIGSPVVNAAITTTTPPNLSVAEAALGLFRTSAPIGTIVKAATMLREVVPSLRDISDAELPRYLISRAQADGIRYGQGTFGLPEPAAAAAKRRLEKELPPHVLFRTHIAIASNYAPWLGVGQLFAGVIPAAAPPDEWLLPERLTEIAYHLTAAIEYLKDADPVLAVPLRGEEDIAILRDGPGNLGYKAIARQLKISRDRVRSKISPPHRAHNIASRLRQARLRLTNLQYFGLADRLSLLRKIDSSGEEAFTEWQRFTKNLAQNELNVLSFRTLHDGTLTILRRIEHVEEKSIRASLLASLQKRFLPALQNAAACRVNIEPSRQLWMSTVVCVLAIALQIQSEGTVSPVTLRNAEEMVDDAAKAGIHLYTLGNCFEYIGDMCWHQGQEGVAQAWYKRGTAHTDNRHLRIATKASLLSNDEAVDVDTLFNLIKTLERYPSQVLSLRKSLLNLIGTACRKLASSSAKFQSLSKQESFRNSSLHCCMSAGCSNPPHGTGSLCRACWGSNVLMEVQAELRALSVNSPPLQTRDALLVRLDTVRQLWVNPTTRSTASQQLTNECELLKLLLPSSKRHKAIYAMATQP